MKKSVCSFMYNRLGHDSKLQNMWNCLSTLNVSLSYGIWLTYVKLFMEKSIYMHIFSWKLYSDHEPIRLTMWIAMKHSCKFLTAIFSSVYWTAYGIGYLKWFVVPCKLGFSWNSMATRRLMDFFYMKFKENMRKVVKYIHGLMGNSLWDIFMILYTLDFITYRYELKSDLSNICQWKCLNAEF
jgi:hypothetical protein